MSHAILTLFGSVLCMKLRMLISIERKRLCWWMLYNFACRYVVTVQVFPKTILLLKTTDLPAGGLHNPVFGLKATYVALSWLLALQIWLASQKLKQNLFFGFWFYITFESYMKLNIEFPSIFTHPHAWYTKEIFFENEWRLGLQDSSFKTKKYFALTILVFMFLFGFFSSVNWLICSWIVLIWFSYWPHSFDQYSVVLKPNGPLFMILLFWDFF